MTVEIEEQCDFKAGRSCLINISTLQQLIEKVRGTMTNAITVIKTLYTNSECVSQ